MDLIVDGATMRMGHVWFVGEVFIFTNFHTAFDLFDDPKSGWGPHNGHTCTTTAHRGSRGSWAQGGAPAGSDASSDEPDED